MHIAKAVLARTGRKRRLQRRAGKSPLRTVACLFNPMLTQHERLGERDEIYPSSAAFGTIGCRFTCDRHERLGAVDGSGTHIDSL